MMIDRPRSFSLHSTGSSIPNFNYSRYATPFSTPHSARRVETKPSRNPIAVRDGSHEVRAESLANLRMNLLPTFAPLPTAKTPSVHAKPNHDENFIDVSITAKTSSLPLKALGGKSRFFIGSSKLEMPKTFPNMAKRLSIDMDDVDNDDEASASLVPRLSSGDGLNDDFQSIEFQADQDDDSNTQNVDK
eukprot:maker-scaffold417_size177606-snap-gene-0.55 protein:Tk07605 transcript:maker-scaffold417_size177606-snap-gene-0.55-mRNA-1 annotation:"glycosyl transferase family protein"